MNGRRLWPVFLTYLLAFVLIVLASLVAIATVRSFEPDLPDQVVLSGLPGLLAGAIASSTGLLVTVLIVVRPLEPAQLRLNPGRETGRAIAVMIAGVLALGQALDSLTVVAGLQGTGSLPVIRRALAGAVGPDLFASVIVIGFFAGLAEEIFFRGYMETRLGAAWRPQWAVVVTSACFGLLHLEWLHAVLAFCLGLYLGYLTELTGSVLPAAACHVVNNVLFTLVAASTPPFLAFWPNVALAAGCLVLFAGCLAWLRYAVPPLAAAR